MSRTLQDDIKAERSGVVESTESLIIEQKLNKLFYAEPKYREELQWLKMKYQQNMGKRYGLHASAILASDNEFCYREQVLSLFYEQCNGENININLKRIFAEGDYIGEKWQRLFIRGGIAIPEDLDISRFIPEYDLSYTPDIAKARFSSHNYMMETKSQNTHIFKKQATHPKGMKQLKFYMYFEKIYRGFVLVEDKNDQNFKVLLAHNCSKDELEVENEKYIERLERIQIYKHDLLNRKKMVAGICSSSNCKRATECNMRDACYNIGRGRIKLDI